MRTRRRHSPSTRQIHVVPHITIHIAFWQFQQHTLLQTQCRAVGEILTIKSRVQSQLFTIYNYRLSYQGTLQGNVSSTRSIQKSPLYHECWSDFKGHKYLEISITH